jgi:hypothetical protein
MRLGPPFMIEPLLSGIAPSESDSALGQAAQLVVSIGGGSRQRLTIDGGVCVIGRGDFCDLQLPVTDGPLAVCEIHQQDRVVWVECPDEGQTIEVNGRPVHRLALRHGDRLTFHNVEVTLDLHPAETATHHSVEEDLSQLTAAELCDRIEAEQAMINDFERRQSLGWEALLVALEGILTNDHSEVPVASPRLESVVEQLHELSTILADHTEVLAEQEQRLLGSTTELQQQQDRMARRLEHLIDQLGDERLRASA